MNRWSIAACLSAALAAPAGAHHGWSSFNLDKPVYLEGRVKSVKWSNPHAELVLEVAGGLKTPVDLPTRSVPAQVQTVDSAAVLKKSQAPGGSDGDWEIEFAPLSRMERWQVRPLKAGDRIEVIGYTGVPGKPKLLRVEYLFVDGKAYGLRSNPAN